MHSLDFLASKDILIDYGSLIHVCPSLEIRTASAAHETTNEQMLAYVEVGRYRVFQIDFGLSL